MIININNIAPDTIKNLKLEDLIADAKARGDKDAIQWLRTEAMKKVPYKGKDNVTKEKLRPVSHYRVEYLTKFCGYEKPVAAKPSAGQKREDMLLTMFDDAMGSIQ